MLYGARKYNKGAIWEKGAVADESRERALALPSFLPFYFRIGAFSISRTRLISEPGTGYCSFSFFNL